MQRLESVKTVQFCIRSEHCYVVEFDLRVVRFWTNVMCLDVVNNWESPPYCTYFPCVAEFSRVCRVSFGTETEDKGIRVSFNTHTGRFIIHLATL